MKRLILAFVVLMISTGHVFAEKAEQRVSGGTIGGLFPKPKHLKGKVDDMRYYAQDNVFSIRLPHPPKLKGDDAYEWKYTQVSEMKEVGEKGSVIGAYFGPAATDLNTYHAFLVKPPLGQDKEADAKKIFENQAKIREEHGFKKYVLKTTSMAVVNGRNSYYAVYENSDYFLVYSLTDYESSFFDLSVDVSKKSLVGKVELDDLIKRKWSTFNDMLESLTVN